MLVANKIISMLAMLVIILVGNVMAGDKIQLGYIEFPPYTSTSPTGEPEGVLIDLAAKVFPEAGYDWYAVSYPTMRMADYLVNGKLDIWMGLKTLPQFKNGRAYIGDSVVANLILFSYSIGDKPPIEKKEDLNGKSVIVMRGYSYGGWIQYITEASNNVSYIKTNKHVAAFNMLKAGRADYVLDYQEPSDKALKKVSIPDLRKNKISALPCYFIVSGKRPDGLEIINRIEKAFKKLKSQGDVN